MCCNYIQVKYTPEVVERYIEVTVIAVSTGIEAVYIEA